MRLLILGGSGFLSGTLVREALSQGHEVSIVTRGQRPVPEKVRSICVDRQDRQKFASTLALEKDWDLVVDSIGFDTDDARQDIEVFQGKCGHLAFVSTDFVYDPNHRSIPQSEESAVYTSESYGGKKREAEVLLQKISTAKLAWTIFRPSHIYGPGSFLGCLPLHGRDPNLLERLRKNETLRLIGGGRFLQHPVFAPDLARTLLDLPGKTKATGKILNVANPDIVESFRYYEIVGEILGGKTSFEEINTAAFLMENPDKAPFCCDRVYDLSLLKASGLYVPTTPLEEGLRRQVEALQSSP